MTTLLDPRPLESPTYWESEPYSCFADFCEQVADALQRNHGWNTTDENIKTNYYARREYDLGESAEATAEMIYEYEITWED